MKLPKTRKVKNLEAQLEDVRKAIEIQALDAEQEARQVQRENDDRIRRMKQNMILAALEVEDRSSLLQTQILIADPPDGTEPNRFGMPQTEFFVMIEGVIVGKLPATSLTFEQSAELIEDTLSSGNPNRAVVRGGVHTNCEVSIDPSAIVFERHL